MILFFFRREGKVDYNELFLIDDYKILYLFLVLYI